MGRGGWEAALAHWTERLDGFLGRLFFRALGLLCAIVALICTYAIFWHFTHWNAEYSLFVVIMFGLVVIAAAMILPYCFSRRRRFVEALDALESEVPDQPRPRR
jgi:hypothetical protein